jgi:pyrimidine operon attenuation protein/uracil phosphoribosyltransferase
MTEDDTAPLPRSVPVAAVQRIDAQGLDAEALYALLREGVRKLVADGTQLIGIWSGGAWLAARLHADLGLPGRPGVISSALHRDDFNARGMNAGADATQLPFEIDGARILLIDDVLFTGRTVRAVINELFDFGRPASVHLAVLVDRDGRELPIEPLFAAARVALPATHRLSLAQSADGAGPYSFSLRDAT